MLDSVERLTLDVVHFLLVTVERDTATGRSRLRRGSEGIGEGSRAYDVQLREGNRRSKEVSSVQNLMHNRRLILGTVVAILVVAAVVLLIAYSGGGYGGGSGGGGY